MRPIPPFVVVVVVATLTTASCDGPEPKYPIADAPMPTAQKVEGPERPPDAVTPDEPDAKLVAGCARGTGKNEAGECEALRREDAGYVQRIQLPRGTFVMGDVPTRYDASRFAEDPRSRWSGNPPRQADIEAYWIDLHEVTRKAYEACVADGKCTAAQCPAGEDPSEKFGDAENLGDLPQTCVTHTQAETFCKAHGGRLPTEAEWEYAARGVDARLYPWGNDFRDEYRNALVPVGGPVDISYFGLRAMGTSAVEWIAEPFEIDVGLQSFVTGKFRKPKGPLERAVAELDGAYTFKGGRAGAREGETGSHPMLGFRCAADLADGEAPLTVPDEAALVPLVVNAAPLQFFGGVAEAVDRDEAKAFCTVLKVEVGGETLQGWRLPTLAEIEASAAVFKGPGPFWTQDGAAAQRGQAVRPTADDPWVLVDEDPAAGLAVRCVRG